MIRRVNNCAITFAGRERVDGAIVCDFTRAEDERPWPRVQSILTAFSVDAPLGHVVTARTDNRLQVTVWAP